tara:strand:+ start:36241 stop:37110 length:870 start_codon:yes stop_codon:yes gene_type:complete
MKKMNLLASAAFAVLALSAVAIPAAAQTVPSTTVTSTWNGAGGFTFDAMGAGSSTGAFSTFGSSGAIGSVSYVNQGNNPYGYNVSNSSLNANASISGGGYVQSSMTRDGSGSMYGSAGQSISSYASSSDGSAALVQHANVNYASMNDLGYGQSRTAGGNTADASGSQIELGYNVYTGVNGNAAGFNMIGNGSGSLLLSSSGASASGLGMGQGQGIYTQALFQAQGSGQFSTGGSTTNSLTNLGGTIYGTVLSPGSVTTTGNYTTTGPQVQQWNFQTGVVAGGAYVPVPQ